MNSVFVNPGIIHVLLMLFWKSLCICFFHIYQIYLLGMIYRPAFQCLFTLYVFERRQFIIEGIREPVWSYIIDVCISFSARDCNACFSRIFEKRTFGYLNEEEEGLFMTLRTFDSFCSSCSNFVTLNSSILLTVVTTYGLNQLGFDNNHVASFCY